MSASTHPHTRRPLVLGCIMLALFMAAIEATIVATAMPQIVGKLGGFALYSWVFAAFLLTQTATTVMFGKLSDIYGRKPVIVAGTVVFLVGSLLCGLAWSMPSLIAFRLLQGLGAGSMQPIAVTIAGDIYQARERLKIQGWLSGVWAAAALVGPFVGGIIVAQWNWRWVFWLNLPIGILTIAGFLLFMHEDIEKKSHAIDYPGAALFSVAMSALLIVLTQNATLTWPEIAGFAALFFIAGILFVMQERRAREPMIALDLWGHRMVATANGALLFSMMTLIGVTSYLPIFIQGVQGRSPIVAGLPLASMMVSWPLASAVSGWILKHFSMRNTLRGGALMIPFGSLFLLLLHPETNPAVAAIGPAIMGFGMGLLNICSVVMIQGSVEWSKRGSATASLIFARTLGNTFGVTALGAILNAAIVWISERETGNNLSPARVREILGDIGTIVGGGANPQLHAALSEGLRLTFWGMIVFSAVAAGFALAIPVRELESLGGPEVEKKSAPVYTGAD